MREGSTASEATGYLRRWFGDADHHELLDGDAEPIADRLHVRYRFRVHDADGWQVVEQPAYCDVKDGKITGLDLVCSGFRPSAAPR